MSARPGHRLWDAPRAGLAAGLRAFAGPHALFWWACAALFIVGGYLRCFRLDMPPFDFPADRQRTNINWIYDFLGGASLFEQRGNWLELPILPWLAARTHWIASLFSLQIWTWARLEAVTFSMATVVFAPLAAWHAAALQGLPAPRRRRLALLFMAAMALNPYLIELSRLIITEPLTLCFQMAAVTWLFMARWHAREPERLETEDFAASGGTRRARYSELLLFVMFFALSCWSKIPALIWAPGFAIYLATGRMLRGRVLIAVSAAAALGAVVFFSLYRINPLNPMQSFAQRFPSMAAESAQWSADGLWLKTYFTRIVLMLTLPGLILAAIGLLRAPWLFSLTFLVFCLCFERLVMLNYYNFCHVIIPGMALAAWGADTLIEAAAPASDPEAHGLVRPAVRRCATAMLILLMIVIVDPLGPSAPHDPLPRADVTQAVEVIHRLTPPGTVVPNDNMEGSLTHFLRQDFDTAMPDLNLNTGYFFSTDRLTTRTVGDAAHAWVAWASLPGEPPGILFSNQPRTQLPPGIAAGYSTLSLAPPPPGPPALDAAQFDIPSAAYDAGKKVLRVAPGTTLTLGVHWRNPTHAAMAAIRWISGDWHTGMPPPLREGGMAIQSATVRLARGGYALETDGVACLPQGDGGAIIYRIEIPADFPADYYQIEYYPLERDIWHPPAAPATPFPFLILVTPREPAKLPIARDFTRLYPLDFMSLPTVWNPARSYRNMKLTGYSLIDAERFLFSCPSSAAGEYEITICGESTPVASSIDPGGLWPQVDILLPGPGGPIRVGSIPMRSASTGDFRARFTAQAPFNSLMLQTRLPPSEGEEPPWMLYFKPARYGRPSVTLRSARLALAPGSSAPGHNP